MKPIVQWPGGKTRLWPEIKKHIPNDYEVWVEPFVGAGSVLFNEQPKKAIVCDMNKDIINLHLVVKNSVFQMLDVLSDFCDLPNSIGGEKAFYQIRGMDRKDDFREVDPIVKAARTIYLSKCSFNGLYRVNKKGQFNTPFNNRDNSREYIMPIPDILGVHNYLVKNDIDIKVQDFQVTMSEAPDNSFVYLDPPYIETYNRYTKGGFSIEQQEILAKECRKLDDRGIKFLASNMNHPKIKELYDGFEIEEVGNKHTIGSGSTNVKEVLIYN